MHSINKANQNLFIQVHFNTQLQVHSFKINDLLFIYPSTFNKTGRNVNNIKSYVTCKVNSYMHMFVNFGLIHNV